MTTTQITEMDCNSGQIPLDHDYSEIASNDTWQTVSSKKRNSSEDSCLNDSSKKTKPIPASGNTVFNLQNRFEPLSSGTQHTENDTTETQPKKESIPPPIFIPQVANVKLMENCIVEAIGREEFSYKCMINNTVKLMLKKACTYRKVVQTLNQKNIAFHTYQLKEDRAYRVVLKNMHHSIDLEEVKDSLEQMGHKVRNIVNARNYQTKAPLPMFFVDLEPSDNNKEIFEINYLLNAKISFEPPRVRKEIVQCKRCQQYGHTKTYCRHPYQCVKCGQKHETSKCTKSSTAPAVCALCGGDHPANYKGCNVYKALQKKEFPPLRNKNIENQEKVSNTMVTKPNPPIPTTSTLTCAQNPGLHTYADITKPKNESNIETNLTHSIQQFFDKFEKLFFQQSQQIGSLLNLLTSLIAKMK